MGFTKTCPNGWESGETILKFHNGSPKKWIHNTIKDNVWHASPPIQVPCLLVSSDGHGHTKAGGWWDNAANTTKKTSPTPNIAETNAKQGMVDAIRYHSENGILLERRYTKGTKSAGKKTCPQCNSSLKRGGQWTKTKPPPPPRPQRRRGKGQWPRSHQFCNCDTTRMKAKV